MNFYISQCVICLIVIMILYVFRMFKNHNNKNTLFLVFTQAKNIFFSCMLLFINFATPKFISKVFTDKILLYILFEKVK